MTKIDLSKLTWKKFRIGDIFHIYGGLEFPQKNRKNGKVPLISASAHNNGISAYIKCNKNSKGCRKNFISVGRAGSIGYAFYHHIASFVLSDTRALVNNKLNLFTGLFIAMSITYERHNFDYGYQMNSKRLNNLKIWLPANPVNNQPDWKDMQQYVQQDLYLLTHKYNSQRIKKLSKHESNFPKSIHWKKIRIGDYFQVCNGKRIAKKDRQPGMIPFISASAHNNGITDYINFNKHKTSGYKKNIIGVNYNGSIGYAFYHQNKCFILDDVKIVSNRHMNLFLGLFVSIAISYERHNFNYGYQLNKGRLSNLRIWLPVNDNNKPNWQFMENYVKSIIHMKN